MSHLLPFCGRVRDATRLRRPTVIGLLALSAFATASGAEGGVQGQQALGIAAAGLAGDRRLDVAAPVNGRASQSVMLAAASAGKRLVVGGERGTIVFSDDCGERWMQAKVPVSVTLTALAFVDDQRGWAIGHGGVVLESHDAGANWTKRLDGRAIAQLAVAAARKAAAAGSDDAKRALADAKRMVADGPDKPLFAVHFWSAQSGIVVGAYGQALTTEDGGANWQWISDRIPNPKGLHLYGLWADGDQVYAVGEQGLVVRSGDRARHFQTVSTPYVGSYFGIAGITRGATPDLLIYGLRGHAYRFSTSNQVFDPLKLASKASVLGVLPQTGRPSLLFDADGQISEIGGEELSVRPVTSSPVGPVLSAVPACGKGVVLAGMRGIALVDPGALAVASAKGTSK